MTRTLANKEAADLLRDEANSLASEISSPDSKLSHRAKAAIQRELRRFREIADALEAEQEAT